MRAGTATGGGIRPVAEFVGGHGGLRDRDGASTTDRACGCAAEPVGERRWLCGERCATGFPQRQKTHLIIGAKRARTSIRMGEGAARHAPLQTPLAEPLSNCGESARMRMSARRLPRSGDGETIRAAKGVRGNPMSVDAISAANAIAAMSAGASASACARRRRLVGGG